MKVELLNHFGDDLMIVSAARVSYDKETKEFREKDARLIKFLLDHKHTSPFRHPQLQFRIECPIYVERQLFKHQVGLCLSGDSLITFIKASGSLQKIKLKDLYEKWNNGRSHQNTQKDALYSRKRISSMKLRVLNEDTNIFETGRVKDVMFSGMKKVYEISCQNGESIKVSEDHRIYTKYGWKSISSGLSQKDFIALNGIKYAGTGDYQDYDKLKSMKNELGSVSAIAEKCNCSYHVVRKWLKIHSLQFEKENTFFKLKSNPWNKGMSGYKLNLSDESIAKKREAAKNVKKGKESHLWKGGTTNERGKIGQWTRSSAKDVHKKYNYTCQSCGMGGDLQAHHIIPVCVDASKAYDFENLITVCRECHIDIHRSQENEATFASRVTGLDFTPMIKDFGKNKKNRTGNKLKAHFSKITKISYVGFEDTYDIEVDSKYHNFIANNIVVHNSANSISGRYVDFSDEYEQPTQYRYQSKDSKQGSDGNVSSIMNEVFTEDVNKLISESKRIYNMMIDFGVAKEQARCHLPLCLMTKFIWTGSFAAFIHLFSLRLKPDAQQETREVAQAMLEAIHNLDGQPFKHSLEALGYTKDKL